MIRYHVFSPHGNITALLAAASGNRAELASSIMKTDTSIEQVGFMDTAEPGQGAFLLRMMGDEFCANAALSSAMLWNATEHEHEFEFSASGLSEPIRAQVAGDTAILRFPASLVTRIQEIPEGHLVDLEGIRFVISGEERTRKEIERILDRYDEPHMPAIGFLHTKAHGPQISITPWVRVRKTGTTIAESACASGSIALAACLRESSSATDLSVRQPSGVDIRIRFHQDGSIIVSGQAPYLGERSLPSDPVS